MGVDLRAIDTDDTVSLSWELWNTLYYIARDHGWEPAGTVLYEEQWDGSYHRNEGELVTTDHAAAIAAALRRALDVVNHAGEVAPATASDDCEPATGTEALLRVWKAIWGVPPERAMCRRMLQRHRQAIQEVITFLEKGAFRIY